jgi:hypothetical protein
MPYEVVELHSGSEQRQSEEHDSTDPERERPEPDEPLPGEREHAVVDAGISTISDLSSCASRPIRGLRA